MEKLIHYVWKHKLFPAKPLATTGGLAVEVIDPGLQNNNAGPDFFNATVKIGATTWSGNVEIHDKASDWYMHGHESDTAYDNVVLHVVGTANREVATKSGRQLPQLELEVPEHVRINYEQLFTTDKYPPCYKIVPHLSPMMVHSWMAALQTERLEQRTEQIVHRLERCRGSWEDVLFITMARNYGFGVNGDAFEQWASAVPLNSVAHHRDDLMQIEAIFLGQAGLLDINTVPDYHRADALKDGYLTRLAKEYAYLSHKFGLQPIDASQWKFMRMRPQNFPHIRISQLANLYFSRKSDLSRLVDCATTDQAKQLLRTHVTPYWETHYTFGGASARNTKTTSSATLELLLINTVVPILFAYGLYRHDQRLCDRACAFLDELKAENNNIVRMWQECGLMVRSAADSQALIQLKKVYCDRRDCLRCRIGYQYLKHNTINKTS